MQNLIIIGSGGHAGAVADAAEAAGFTVLGYYDHSVEDVARERESFDSLDGINWDKTALALGIGANFAREDAYIAIRKSHPSAAFPVIIHPSGSVSALAKLEEGVVVMGMASVGPGCTVNVGSLLNTGSSLDHDSHMGPFSSLGPGARTGGSVRIGGRTVIALNAGVLQGVSIGSDTIVGAHAFVNKDIPASTVAYGVPALPIRQRNRSDNYY